MAEEFPVPPERLRKLVKKSRQMPIAFGFNAGTSDDDDEYLAAHERKAPELMGKIAKTEGAGTKSAYGTFVAEGSEIRLTCFQTIGQLAKKFKKYLKVNKITLNVVVTDPDGNVIDSDVEVLTDWFRGDDEDDDALATVPPPPPRADRRAEAPPKPAPKAPPPPPADWAAEVPPPREDALPEAPPPRPQAAPPPPRAKAPPPPPKSSTGDPEMDERVDRIRDIQARLRGMPPAVTDRLVPELQRAVGMLRDRRFEDVDALLKPMIPVLARLMVAAKAPPAPPRPEMQDKAPPPAAAAATARLKAAIDTLQRQALGLPKAAAADAQALLDKATAAVKAGEPEAALAALKGARDRLRDLQAARQKWGKVQALMQGPVDQALNGGGLANPAALQRRWAAVQALADAGRWPDALAAVPGFAALVRHAVLAARRASA